jgi:hypothetical protein
MHLFQAIKVPSSTHPSIRGLYRNNALLFHGAGNIAPFRLSIMRYHSPPPCAIFLATANSTKWLSRVMLLWLRHYFSLWPDLTTGGFSYRPLEFAVKVRLNKETICKTPAWSENLKQLDRLLTLSCNAVGTKALLNSVFFEPNVACNIYGAWLQGAFAFLDSDIVQDQHILLRILMKRDPSLGFL